MRGTAGKFTGSRYCPRNENPDLDQKRHKLDKKRKILNLINIESDLSNTCIAGFATRQVKFAPLSAEVTG